VRGARSNVLALTNAAEGSRPREPLWSLHKGDRQIDCETAMIGCVRERVQAGVHQIRAPFHCAAPRDQPL